jgi:CheY-like chemotaxis protein
MDPLLPGGQGSTARKVLVVDDEADQRYLLRRCLESAGYEVSEAGNGVAALQSIEDDQPDLVVTDVMMPVMTGSELITRLRAAESTAAIPILAVTGDGGLASGADALLAKPFGRNELITVAEGLIHQEQGPA